MVDGEWALPDGEGDRPVGLRLAWQERDGRAWDRLLASAGPSCLEQCWAYGEALRQVRRCTVRRAVVLRGAAPVAMFQAFGKRTLLEMVRVLRGPLWLEDDLPSGGRQAVLRLIRNQFRLGRAELLIWSPELPATAEAHGMMRACGMRRMVTGYSTSLLDLSRSPDDLRAGLQGKWRNRLAAAERADLRVRVAHGGRPLAWLLERFEEHRRRKGLIGLPANLVQGIAAALPDKRDLLVLTAVAAGQWVAGLLVIRHGAAATYLLAWTGEEGRRLRAQNLLLWRAITELGARGVGTLDLGGVDAVAAPGLARFKLGLGGRLHTLLGSYF